MSAPAVNYEDIYEEFVLLSSSTPSDFEEPSFPVSSRTIYHQNNMNQNSANPISQQHLHQHQQQQQQYQSQNNNQTAYCPYYGIAPSTVPYTAAGSNNGFSSYSNAYNQQQTQGFGHHQQTQPHLQCKSYSLQPFQDAMNCNTALGSRAPWNLNADSPFPGGLEVLWREVPEECQKIMTLQDVPDTARLRGYFTVCELIALKRSLMNRLGTEKKDVSGEGSIGMALKEAMITLDDDQSNCVTSGEGSVGMALKEAMNTLEEDQSDQKNLENQSNIKNEYSGNGPESGTIPTTYASSTSFASYGTNNTTGESGSKNLQIVPQNNPVGLPPPYRTATLVFKLLQIGNCQFRSYSEVNPNRLRVLFNTQRLTYECQLSLVRPPREGMVVLRKLLTVDIGFDQISMIRFGTDKLFLRVEGAPLLTVTYNPANDDTTCPPLSQQDHHLLEQIDKGQLKLSPCHQLYFLNERLVHLLEVQFKELPRFRHILQEGYELPQPIYTPC